MGTLARCDSLNESQFNKSSFSGDCECGERSPDMPGTINVSLQRPADVSSRLRESAVDCDYFGGVFEYINQLLMEEEDDLENRTSTFQDYYALEAAEKSFHDALRSDKNSASFDPNLHILNHEESRSISACDHMRGEAVKMGDSSRSLNNCGAIVVSPDSNQTSRVSAGVGGNSVTNSTNKNSTRTNNNRDRREGDDQCPEERNSKQRAIFADEPELSEKYDKVMLCSKMNPGFYIDVPANCCEESRDEEDERLRSFRNSTVVKRGRPKGSKNQTKAREVIDLRNLLSLCAEAVSKMNSSTSEVILKQIRQHSSPYGDANERLAHYFGNALEARMAGTGSALNHAFATRRVPASEFLKSYQTYVAACPFKRMSNIYANKSIGREARKANRIHVIDFGIKYGFQWPCFIQGVSLRPAGPPTLKITGIDFPQPGLNPSERVDQTGRHLRNYCKRFNVPFEYNSIAKKWEDISLEELNIGNDEFVVVNCLHRLDHVLDESAGVDSPRDDVLKLIKRIRPDLFVHGVINGTYNAPFFPTRFRETLHHYSSFFDILEATIPREDQDRLAYERQVFGREVMNVIACEGCERVERPETYKQWQVRNSRAGFRQLPLNRELFREAKTKVCRDYHSYFLLDEDSEWMLQGWKGRVMYALSCWKPIRD